MSKFLTPPVWYDKNGSEINIFNNTTYSGVPENTAIGTSAIAGEGGSYGAAVAVGSQAQAKASLSIAIGSYNDDNFQTVQALARGSIAIGAGAKAGIAKSLAIGYSAKTEGVGEGLIAIGYQSIASDNNTIAIGSGAQVKASGSIAIGAGATANETPNTIQLGNNNTAYTLNIGNGNASIGNFKITPIKSGDYANQVILDNVNQIKTPVAGISFEAGERRGVGTIIFPTKIKTKMVESDGYSVSAISYSSTNGSLKLAPNFLYLIICGGKRAMLHTTQSNSDTYQFIYGAGNATDLVMHVYPVDSNTTSVTCELQIYDRNTHNYTKVTDNNFTAIKVCSFTY